jgi:hypothetical protein
MKSKAKPIDLDDTESNEDWIKEVTRKGKKPTPAKKVEKNKTI